MKSIYKMAVVLVAGAGIGGAIIEGLHAQAKPPTYVVIAIRKINNAEAFKTSVIDKSSQERLKAAGAHYVARTQKITAIDGTPPQRFIMIAFDSPEKAEAWRNTPEQKAVDAGRKKNTDSLSFMVEGM